MNQEVKEVLTKIESEGKKPITLKIWVVAVIAFVSFVAGAIVF